MGKPSPRAHQPLSNYTVESISSMSPEAVSSSSTRSQPASVSLGLQDPPLIGFSDPALILLQTTSKHTFDHGISLTKTPRGPPLSPRYSQIPSSSRLQRPSKIHPHFLSTLEPHQAPLRILGSQPHQAAPSSTASFILPGTRQEVPVLSLPSTRLLLAKKET